MPIENCVKIVELVLKYSCNVSFDEFKQDLKDILNAPFVAEWYAEEKFEQMRNFTTFYCNLDDDTKKRFVKAALSHYNYPN